MKRFLVVLFMLSLVPACWAENPWNWGYVNLATPSFTIGSGTAVNIGANIPKGVTSISLTAFGGDLVLNCSEDIAKGAMYNGDKVASGSTVTWTGFDPEQSYPLNFYGLALDSTVTVKLRAWRGFQP